MILAEQLQHWGVVHCRTNWIVVSRTSNHGVEPERFQHHNQHLLWKWCFVCFSASFLDWSILTSKFKNGDKTLAGIAFTLLPGSEENGWPHANSKGVQQSDHLCLVGRHATECSGAIWRWLWWGKTFPGLCLHDLCLEHYCFGFKGIQGQKWIGAPRKLMGMIDGV